MLDREYRRIGFYLILPALIGLIFFRLYPIIASFFISFTDWNVFGKGEWVGLENYVDAFFSKEGRQIILNTVLFTIIYVRNR